MEKPQKQLTGKVLGVALVLLENICPISLPEADNNAKPWSQPPSFPSPLPGSPRLHRTPWLPGPPDPCAQPLQKQPVLAPWTPRRRLRAAVTTGSPSAERTRPHVARVSSWTRTRTPEGPLRARSGSAGATEAAAPVRREQGPHPRLLSAAARAARREDLERPLHRDAPAAAAAWRRTGAGTCPRGMGPVPCFAAAAPPDLPHVLRF